MIPTWVVVIAITLTLVVWLGCLWHDTVTVRRIKKQMEKDNKWNT
jgi:hypothetical protein